MRIIIIGAGLGGLTLMHGLRRAGMDARVYERSSDAGAQPASYGIHLDADGLAALHANLPEENWRMIDAAGVPAPLIVRFRDSRHGILSTVDKRFPENQTDPVTKRRAISRGLLRAALLHGLEGAVDGEPLVSWGRKSIGYESHGDRVRVRFEDGSAAEGDLLIGADGSGSHVRRQLLPHLEREDLGILDLAGRTPLTPQLAKLLDDDMIDGGINNVVPAGTGWMFFSTWDTGDPDVADLSRGATRYIVWAWAASRASYPADVDGMDGAQMKALVQGYISGWDPRFRAIVGHTEPAALSRVPLRTMPHLTPWAPSNVTLLGDAIHNMTPMAGIGANTALRDAEHLRSALIEHRGGPVVDAVRQYEIEMRGYANEALALSTRNASAAALSSAAGRRAFRTVLRVGSVVAPLKRKMFGPTLPVGGVAPASGGRSPDAA